MQETCVAECVHWVLLFLSPVFLVTMARPYSVVAAVLYALSHIPFIMIQRYNRPRLLAANRLAQARGKTAQPCETAPAGACSGKEAEAV